MGQAWPPVPLFQQRGIGKVQGSGGSTAGVFVTFPVAFQSGTVPVVLISFRGWRSAGAFNPVGLSANQLVYASAQEVDETGFAAYLAGTTLSASNDYYFQWLAMPAS